MNEEKLLNLDDLADYLDVSRRTVYRLLKSEDLPGYRVGSHLRFRRDDIDQWLTTKKIDKSSIG